jgi:hypothetical protein
VKQLNLSNPSEAENNARAAAAVTSYGVGTRSYNKSSEKREMDRQREEVTAKYQAGQFQMHDCSSAFLLCRCRSFHNAHSPDLHSQLRADYDWRSPEERRSTYFKGGWK